MCDVLDERAFVNGIVGLNATGGSTNAAPHLPAMAANLAAALGIRPDQVRVAAKAVEGLGFAGRGEGIASLAVCLLAAAGD